MSDDDTDWSQCGNPRGEGGIATLERMNSSHDPLTRWGLSHLHVESPGAVLDVGCGGGNLLHLLGGMYPDAELYGIDTSETAISLTRSVNPWLVSSGRLQVSIGDVSDIEFPDGSFDLVTAVETYFFWPDLEKGIGEITRVLRDGGSLMVVAESYPHPQFEERNAYWVEMTGMKLVANERMCEIMESAGLSPVTYTDESKNWVAFVATKGES